MVNLLFIFLLDAMLFRFCLQLAGSIVEYKRLINEERSFSSSLSCV